MTALTSERKPATAGEPERWNAKWSHGGGGKLFTRGRPRTNAELCHQVYFFDLWLATLGYTNPLFCELGAGRGTTAQYLASRGADVTLVDLSVEGFKQACENFASEGMAEPNCVLCDVENLAIMPESFDCVYSIGLLEHFHDASRILDETHLVLKPGGLMWHVVLDGAVFQSADVLRVPMDANKLITQAEAAGFNDASCAPYRFDGVWLLRGTK